MIGTTLGDIRSYVEALASEGGSYYLVCARTGDRPVPSGDLRFANRVSARAAATATEQYRAALRRYDPQLPYYDVVACEASETGPEGGLSDAPATTADSERPRDATNGTVVGSPEDSGACDRSALVEFCHRVAASVFEALSAASHDAVESAVMDTYVALAEDVDDPDELCCCLLECMATEIDSELSPRQQAEILQGAVERLPSPPTTDRPVWATLRSLQQRGLIGGHAHSPWSVDAEDGSRSVVLLLSEYALSPREDRLPVLPLAVELFRHQQATQPTALEVVEVDPGWKLELTLAWDEPPSGLASAPIRRRA